MEMEFGNFVVEKTLRGSQFRFQRPRTPGLLGRPNAGLLAGLGFAPARPQGLAEPIEEEEGREGTCSRGYANVGLGGSLLRAPRGVRIAYRRRIRRKTGREGERETQLRRGEVHSRREHAGIHDYPTYTYSVCCLILQPVLMLHPNVHYPEPPEIAKTGTLAGLGSGPSRAPGSDEDCRCTLWLKRG